ncbi:hypothetical protein BKA93DRAFT_754223 [Sparassis latifolia]
MDYFFDRILLPSQTGVSVKAFKENLEQEGAIVDGRFAPFETDSVASSTAEITTSSFQGLKNFINDSTWDNITLSAEFKTANRDNDVDDSGCTLGWDPTVTCLVHGDKTSYDITDRAKNGEVVVFRTSDILSDSGALRLHGRGTRVYRARRLDEDGSEVGNDIVVKDILADNDHQD